jgi:hypothetical protein
MVSFPGIPPAKSVSYIKPCTWRELVFPETQTPSRPQPLEHLDHSVTRPERPCRRLAGAAVGLVARLLTPSGSTPAALLSRHACVTRLEPGVLIPCSRDINKKARIKRALLFMASPRGLFVARLLTPSGSTPAALLSRHACVTRLEPGVLIPCSRDINKKARIKRALLFMASPRGFEPLLPP